MSVAKGTTFGSTTFTIVALNAAARQKMMIHWPRLDKVSGTPLPPLLANIHMKILGT